MRPPVRPRGARRSSLPALRACPRSDPPRSARIAPADTASSAGRGGREGRRGPRARRRPAPAPGEGDELVVKVDRIEPEGNAGLAPLPVPQVQAATDDRGVSGGEVAVPGSELDVVRAVPLLKAVEDAPHVCATCLPRRV